MAMEELGWGAHRQGRRTGEAKGRDALSTSKRNRKERGTGAMEGRLLAKGGRCPKGQG